MFARIYAEDFEILVKSRDERDKLLQALKIPISNLTETQKEQNLGIDLSQEEQKFSQSRKLEI